MALLEILRFPDPRLHTVAAPVAKVDARIQQLVKDMAQTMYEAPGVGLAATQVNVHERVIVIDVSETNDQLLVFINPELVSASEDSKLYEEGCLSVPGVYEDVERPDRIVVRALNAEGQPFEMAAEGLLSVCLQHEMDHLAGKVFVQYLSRLKQSRVRSKMQKLDRAPA